PLHLAAAGIPAGRTRAGDWRRCAVSAAPPLAPITSWGTNPGRACLSGKHGSGEFQNSETVSPAVHSQKAFDAVCVALVVLGSPCVGPGAIPREGSCSHTCRIRRCPERSLRTSTDRKR